VNVTRSVTEFTVYPNQERDFEIDFPSFGHIELELRGGRDLYVSLNLIKAPPLFQLIILGNRPRAVLEAQISKVFPVRVLARTFR
jgi:hypothetical protein